MNAHDLIASPLVYRLGWTLLHSFWQGAAVAGLLALLLWLLSRASANTRYLTASAALLLALALSVATFQLVSAPNPLITPLTMTDPTSSLPQSAIASASPGHGEMSSAVRSSTVEIPVVRGAAPAADSAAAGVAPAFLSQVAVLAVRLEPAFPWLVGAWVLGVFALSLWHLGGCIAVQRLKSLGTHPADSQSYALLTRLTHRMNLPRPVRLLQSVLVETPVVIGCLRPIILIPASVLTGLAPAQLEAILAHELAHVRRHDYLVNLLQTVIETLLFYHPAIWWISRQVRREREHCCDDIAVQVCGNRLTYTTALAAIEEVRRVAPVAALAAGGNNHGELLGRIQRLLGLPARRPAGTLLAACLVIGLLLVSLFSGALAAPAPRTAQDQRIDKRIYVLRQPATQPARTLTYRATVQKPGHADQTWNAMVKDGRDRMEMSDGKVLIGNAIEGKALFLDPEHKTATISTLENVRRDHPGFPFYNLEKMADSEAHPVVSLGKKQIAGTEADGIRFTVGPETRTVWRDPATRRPVQFETELAQFSAPPLHFTFTDIIFDAPLDDSLFAIQPPPGYERKEGPRMRFQSVQIPATHPVATQSATPTSVPETTGSITASQVADYHKALTGETLSYDALKKRYADQAMKFAQTGGDPHELEVRVRRALAFSQDEATLVRLYTYLGDACWLQTNKYTPEVWRPQRLKAAQAYLDGLTIVMQHDLPAQPPTLPAVGRYEVPADPPEVIEPYRQKHAQEIAARELAERVAQLVRFRQTLTGQLVQMYAREPDNFDQLHQLVLNHLGSQEAANSLVAGAKAYRENPHAPQVVLPATRPATLHAATASDEAQLATRAAAALGDTGWGPPTRGLRCRWVQARRAYPAGALATIRLEVQNISDQPAFLECQSGSTWCVGYIGKKADNGGILPEFSVALGKGARLATYREVKGELGFGINPQSRGPFGPDDPVPAWYRLNASATMTLVWQYPYVLADEGTVTFDSILNRSDPGGGRIYLKEQRDLNTLRCPSLEINVTAGDPNAKHAYDIAWGAASDGLQAGISYEFGRRPVPLGKLAALNIRIRNTSNKAIKLTYSQTGYRDNPPEVRDAAGQPLPVRMPAGEDYPHMTIEIPPGQMIGLDNASFTVLPNGEDAEKFKGPTLRASPGRYTVTKVFRYNTDEGKELNKQLTAGPIEVEVAGELSAPATSSAPAGVQRALPVDLDTRVQFLAIERIARLPAADQANELRTLYRELAPRYMNPFVEGILSSAPTNILDRRPANGFSGNTALWAKQLAEAAPELGIEAVADKLESGLWLNVAARARALQVLKAHAKATEALLQEDLKSGQKPLIQRGTQTILALDLRSFTEQLLVMFLAEDETSEPAGMALLFMRDPTILQPLLARVEKDPKFLSRCAGHIQSPLWRKPAEPLLLKLLDSPDAEVRYNAGRAVYECRDPKLAAPAVKFAREKEPRFRIMAAYLASNLPADAFTAVRKDLMLLLKDTNEDVRVDALRCFAQQKDLAACPVILDLLNRTHAGPAGQHEVTVMQALVALTGKQFGYDMHNWGPGTPRNQQAIRQFEDWMATQGVPLPATQAAKAQPADIQTSLQDLATRMMQKDWEVYSRAITEAAQLVLSQPVGREMAAFQPLVAPLFAHANWGGIGEREGRLAADALVRIGSPAVLVLVAKLKSADDHDRWSAMDVLGRIGEPKSLVLASARSLLKDGDSYVRRVAIDTLGKLGKDALPAVPDLKAQDAVEKTLTVRQNNQEHEYEPAQVHIELALIGIQGASPERIAALARHLTSDDKNQAAAYAAAELGELGTAARTATPELLAALRHTSAQVRVNAAGSLGKIGADDEAVIEGLIDRLKNDVEPYARQAAAGSLGLIGPKAKAALPPLRQAAKADPEWWG